MATCLGNCFLKREAYAVSPQLITMAVMKVLNKTSWKIEHQQYHEQKWAGILRMMLEANIQHLEIELTYTHSVLNDIAGIKFLQLTYLNLEVNNIASIEPLSGLKAPVLEKLRLAHNLIISVRPVAKMHCKYLSQLHLQGNFINEFDDLALACFSHNFESLAIETWNEKRVQGDDLRWVIKLRLKNLKKIQLASSARIQSSVMMEMIRNKYPKLRC